jgi:PAS domain S-box-containing protein
MKILVADDHSDDRLLAIRELRRVFPDADCVEIDSAEAFETALTGSFDLVVSDYSMGWMNGLEVLRAVKAHAPDLPVIMLTGTGGEEIAVEAMHAGVDDYLLKRDLKRLAFAAQRALERANSRAEARQAQQRYRDLFRSVPVGLGLCQADGALTEANEALLQLLGARSSSASLCLTDAFHPDHRVAWEPAKAGKAPEVRLQRQDGSTAWAVLRARAVEGRALGSSGMQFECALTDVTDLKMAQQERGALLGELYHRVNNNLQLLTAFVVSLSNQSTDPVIRQGLEDLTNRIHSISLVQGRLYKSGDFERVNLREFLDELLESMLQGSTVHLSTEMEDVVVPVAQAIPIGLIANELLINALKHAFPKVEAPTLAVRLRRKGDLAALHVEDNGVGMSADAAAPVRGGYGTKLIRSLTRQADATLETRSDPGAGTRVVLSFPAK